MVIIPNMPNQFFYSETVTLEGVTYELNLTGIIEANSGVSYYL